MIDTVHVFRISQLSIGLLQISDESIAESPNHISWLLKDENDEKFIIYNLIKVYFE